MNIISKGVGKTYKIKKGLFRTYSINVLENFNYTIKQGELIGFLGMEGSGKSTILNLLSGRIKPTYGHVLIDGEENYKKLRSSSEIISDFSKIKLLDNESVYNNFVHFGLLYRQDKLDVEKNIAIFREIFELEKIINKKVNALNSLEKIKVNIVVSMLKNIKVLFFDSALSNLTIVEKNIVLKILKRLNKEYKTTIVVSSNNLVDLEKICKRITVIKKGEIIKDVSCDYLKQEIGNKKEITILFNKNVAKPKGNFEIIEESEYLLKLKVDFDLCDFATLINEFDINTIVDITISNISLLQM